MEGEMTVYGYARVSTDGQSVSAQLAELKAAKCEKIFQEKNLPLLRAAIYKISDEDHLPFWMPENTFDLGIFELV
jgi:DNA invertase Pin-like site-specific DNA recombinase